MHLSRRHFLTATFLGAIAGVLYFKGQKISLYDEKVQVLLATAYHLYPTSPLGFGVKEVNLASYLVFVLEDDRIIQGDKDFLLNGGKWIEEEARKKHDRGFVALNSQEKESLLQGIIEFNWGYNYINYLFNYIFEAMFSAPVYGSNTDEIGWKWAGHQAGFPQPQKLKDIDYV